MWRRRVNLSTLRRVCSDSMKKYKIFIEGKNLSTNIDGQVGKRGFFTTRFIEAEDARDAENIALRLIRNELQSVILNVPSDPPTILVEEINEVVGFEAYPVPGAGFTWFDSE